MQSIQQNEITKYPIAPLHVSIRPILINLFVPKRDYLSPGKKVKFSPHTTEHHFLALFVHIEREKISYILLERESETNYKTEASSMRKKNKHTISVQKSSSMIKKETTATLSPARKSRTKTRKPKYLSLRLQISPENTQQSGENMPSTGDDHRHQLNLFPLHPENLVEDKDPHDDNVAYFFSTVDGGATTLTALLGPGASSSASHHEDNNAATLSPESLTYAYGGQDSEEVEQQLVRTAMRNKAREPSEEKWVSCCSPGSVSDLRCKNGERRTIQRQRLSLKLDYEEIMNAWSDKGPLYIHVDSPQVVPDLSDDDFFSHHPSTNVSQIFITLSFFFFTYFYF